MYEGSNHTPIFRVPISCSMFRRNGPIIVSMFRASSRPAMWPWPSPSGRCAVETKFFRPFFSVSYLPHGAIGPISRVYPHHSDPHHFNIYPPAMQLPDHSNELKVEFPAEHVMLLILNRPAALNTMTPTLEANLKTLLDWFDGVPELWCVPPD